MGGRGTTEAAVSGGDVSVKNAVDAAIVRFTVRGELRQPDGEQRVRQFGRKWIAKRSFLYAELTYREAVERGHPALRADLAIVLSLEARDAEARELWAQCPGREVRELYQAAEATCRLVFAEQIERSDPFALGQLGFYAMRLGRAREAEHWCRRAAEGGNNYALVNLGLLLEQTGRATEAQRCYRDALAAGMPAARERLAALLANDGRADHSDGEPA